MTILDAPEGYRRVVVSIIERAPVAYAINYPHFLSTINDRFVAFHDDLLPRGPSACWGISHVGHESA